MNESLRKLSIQLRSGDESFYDGSELLGFKLLDFWRWSFSDLVANTTRGVLAEFLIAKALGVDTNVVREEWAAYDLCTAENVTVQVKTSAYLQSWHQNRLSDISFNISKKRAFNAVTNTYDGIPRRQADVYVFALLAHKDKATINPLDVRQWEFYVLPTKTLDERKRSQHSITLPSLKRIAQPVTFGQIAVAIKEAYQEQCV